MVSSVGPWNQKVPWEQCSSKRSFNWTVHMKGPKKKGDPWQVWFVLKKNDDSSKGTTIQCLKEVILLPTKH